MVAQNSRYTVRIQDEDESEQALRGQDGNIRHFGFDEAHRIAMSMVAAGYFFRNKIAVYNAAACHYTFLWTKEAGQVI